MTQTTSDTTRLDWVLRHTRGSELRRLVGVLSCTSDLGEFRIAIDAHLAKETPLSEASPTSRTPDSRMTTFLSAVVGVVEANSFEMQRLWAENCSQEQPKTWVENNCGRNETVGYVGDMPVCVGLITAEIGGDKILFVEPVSQVVDHRIVLQWLKEVLPVSAFHPDGRINRTDAANFYNVFPGKAAEDV